MSFKGEAEDKAVEPPLPRSIPALRALIDEVKQSITQNRTDALRRLLPKLEQQWKSVNAEMIEASRVGMREHLQAFSGVCTVAAEIYGQGMWMTNNLGTPRA